MIKRARDLLFQRSIFSIYIEYLIDNLEFQLFSLLVSLFVKFNIENDTEVVAEPCSVRGKQRSAFSFMWKFRDRDHRIIERTIAAD